MTNLGYTKTLNYGWKYKLLWVIVDTIVDLFTSRGAMNFKRLSLTDLKVDIPRMPTKNQLAVAIESADVYNKWANSSWGRKLIDQKKSASLNDWERFKVMVARVKRGRGFWGRYVTIPKERRLRKKQKGGPLWQGRTHLHI
ncbi:hypothetical protein KP509_14G010100 [Ceratopteris richardii]|uniref:Large ribosomal subunit protein eL14 domain-containing protein n=1 Tax=Ceratopteris richardii TaxID=49495 RepID=A0A8T2T5L4_CERRI|nr:hypothetical protein KP509_14G010100 [Ceratopteris richardii]